MTPAQTEQVKKHLALVFKHEIDPSYGDKEKQAELDKIHNNPWPNATPGWQNKDIKMRC